MKLKKDIYISSNTNPKPKFFIDKDLSIIAFSFNTFSAFSLHTKTPTYLLKINNLPEILEILKKGGKRE